MVRTFVAADVYVLVRELFLQGRSTPSTFDPSEASIKVARGGPRRCRTDLTDPRVEIRFGGLVVGSLFQMQVFRFLGCVAWVGVSEVERVGLFVNRTTHLVTALIFSPITVRRI
jgi:hypothetical protein